MTPAIVVEGLQKAYGKHQVLKGLNLRVNRGETFALLGVNGAGKTTALTCIEGLRPYDGGRVQIQGKMGIQLQSASLPGSIRAIEAIRLFAKWNRAPVSAPLLEALGIGPFARQQYSRLSTGQKRRLHLALALLGEPDILFLDEPTAGLDVAGRVSLHGQIRRIQSQGKTILLASHDMAEVESLCSRIAILAGGRIAFTGTVAELHARVGRQYNITLKTDQGTERVASENIGETLLALLTHCRERGATILDIQVDRGSLEQHFMKIAGEECK